MGGASVMFGTPGWTPAPGCVYPDCESPAVDDWSLCGHHHWVVQAEVAEGLRLTREYLKHWAEFEDWADARGLVVV